MGNVIRAHYNHRLVPHDSAVGIVVAGKYRIGRVLGQGGMGIVYEAENVVLGRKVALKRLKDAALHDAALVTRFLQEARAAAAIGHDHIVDILDVVTDEAGVVYIVMELLTGESLATRLAADRRLSPDFAVEVIAQMLEALAAAHDRGIIHRDLKPENLWLETKPEAKPFVKLLDFGISKVVDLKLRVSTDKLTETGMMMGTAHYMSPEQARGSASVDHRTDLWSAGALLYECLSGRTPFQESNYNAMIGKLLTEDPPDLAALAPEVPEHVIAVVRRALSKDPNRRFQTAGEMRAALLAEPVPAAPPRPEARVLIDSDASKSPEGGEPGATATSKQAAFGLAETRVDPRTPAPTPFGAESTPPNAPPQSRAPMMLALAAVAAASVGLYVIARDDGAPAGHPESPESPPTPPAAVDAGTRAATDGGTRAAADAGSSTPPTPVVDAGRRASADAGGTPPLATRSLRVVVTQPREDVRVIVGGVEKPGPEATFDVPAGVGPVTVRVFAARHRPQQIEHDPVSGTLIVALARLTTKRPGIDEDNPYRKAP
jgi:serine/threonine-protein kinase